MKNSPTQARPDQSARHGDRGILCPKCIHLNPTDRTHCRYCNAHLFVSCKKCGARLQRAITRCPECHHQMHKSRLQKLRRRLFRRTRSMTWVQLGLAVVSAYAAYRIILMATGKL